jgi:inhibitor of KinA sporulation pathway (predicted exonuclease)
MSEVPARPPAHKLLVVDLEATCWERRVHRAEDMETIEIGALLVELAAPDAPPREFQAFVRPRERPELSAFCRELTGIRQADVDAALGFERVFPSFLEWIGALEGVRFGSWGRYDRRQFETDCARHGLAYPFGDEHLNLKHWWSAKRGCKPCGLSQAVVKSGLEFAGQHHRGLDDARNIWRVVRAAAGSAPDELGYAVT